MTYGDLRLVADYAPLSVRGVNVTVELALELRRAR
jgi:hypothetical protein